MDEESYKIPIDGEWFLEDLYIFPKTYEQVYFLYFSLLPHDDGYTAERIERVYEAFPWHGGYSAVNFYNSLKYLTPKSKRPQILSLQYASPGWIELSLYAGVAFTIAGIVKSVSRTIRECNSTYHEIYMSWQQRKMLSFKTEEARLRVESMAGQLIEQDAERMARMLGFENVAQIHKRTGSPWKTVKILFSLFRRVRTLAEFQNNDKLKF